MTLASAKQRSTFVQETDDPFLTLWPHRFDYLYSAHPDPGQKPSWRTETRHPLSDRLIHQATYLYGVRFGTETRYLMLDVDAGSPYHPHRDRLALDRLTAALEPLGLVSHLAVTSSDSGGLHLYFPFPEPLPSYQIALAAATLLQNAGFKVMGGWLEVFPNPKPYAADGTMSLFNAHRLPLQLGSYLLNDDLQPVSGQQLTFVKAWSQTSDHNDINTAVLEQTVREAKRKNYRVSAKAQKFLADLDAEIEPGWTGKQQTNRLLGRICMRSYVFGHVLGALSPLNGKALIDEIVRIARSLPGFTEFCGHIKELRDRAKAWAKSIENGGHYFPYGRDKLATGEEPSWHQQQQQAARDRITSAVIRLIQGNNLPDGITNRCKALAAQGISTTTLYKHKDLWHPSIIREVVSTTNEAPEAFEIEQEKAFPPNPPDSSAAEVGVCAEGAPRPSASHKLIPPDRCNALPRAGQTSYQPDLLGEGLCNSVDALDTNRARCDHTETAGCDDRAFTPIPRQLALNVKALLARASSTITNRQHQGKKQVERCQEQKVKRADSARQQRLQEWLKSGDPVLMAEARKQLGKDE